MKNIALLIVLSLLSFLSHAADSKVLAESSHSWNGTKMPPFESDNPVITIKRIVIEPGETLPVHLHPVINAGVLTSGQLTVYTENGTQSLTIEASGDDGVFENSVIIETVNQYHYGVNNGSIPAVIYVFYFSDGIQTLTKLKD